MLLITKDSIIIQKMEKMMGAFITLLLAEIQIIHAGNIIVEIDYFQSEEVINQTTFHSNCSHRSQWGQIQKFVNKISILHDGTVISSPSKLTYQEDNQTGYLNFYLSKEFKENIQINYPNVILYDGDGDPYSSVSFTIVLTQYIHITTTIKRTDEINMALIRSKIFIDKFQTFPQDLQQTQIKIIINEKALARKHISLQIIDGELCIILLIQQKIFENAKITISLFNHEIRDESGRKNRFLIQAQAESPIMYFTPSEVILIDNVSKYAKGFSKLIIQSLSLWKFVGISYLVSNLMAVFHLTIFYIFVPLQSLVWPIRYLNEDLLHNLKQITGIPTRIAKLLNKKPIPLQKFYFVNETSSKELNGFKWINSFGFNYNVFANIWQDFTILPIFALKCGILKLISAFCLCKICSINFREFFVRYKKFLFFQIICISPCIFISLSSFCSLYADNFVSNFNQKVNSAFIYTIPFFCLLIPFWIVISEIKNIRKSHKKAIKALQKEKKKNKRKIQEKKENKIVNKSQFYWELIHQENKKREKVLQTKEKFRNKKIQEVIKTQEYMMFIIIPFMAGFSSIRLFLISTSIITTLRLVIFLWNLNVYGNFDKIKNITNSIFWCTYNGLFLALWWLDSKEALFTDPKLEKISKNASIYIVICVQIHGLIQLFFIAIDLANYIWKKVRKIAQKNKIQPFSDIENKIKKINQENKKQVQQKRSKSAKEQQKQRTNMKVEFQNDQSQIINKNSVSRHKRKNGIVKKERQQRNKQKQLQFKEVSQNKRNIKQRK